MLEVAGPAVRTVHRVRAWRTWLPRHMLDHAQRIAATSRPDARNGDARPEIPGGRRVVQAVLPPAGQCWWASSSDSSGLSTTRVSVVSSREAIEAALASAERVTLTGSMTPASTRLTYSPVRPL